MFIKSIGNVTIYSQILSKYSLECEYVDVLKQYAYKAPLGAQYHCATGKNKLPGHGVNIHCTSLYRTVELRLA